MPPEEKFRPASFRLSDADLINLAKLANAVGKSKAELGRDAIRWYLENQQTISNNERQDNLSKVILKCTDRIIGVIKSCTNRICSLQVRAIIDTNITMMMFYRLLPKADADKIAANMYRMAVTRVMRRLPPEELEITRMISKGLEQEVFDEVSRTMTPSPHSLQKSDPRTTGSSSDKQKEAA